MAKIKKCTKCKKEKSLSDFYKCSRLKSGVQSSCKICLNQSYTISRNKKKDHYNKVKRNRRELYKKRIDEWKLNQKCYFCFESDPCCLDLHHLNPKKKEGEISNMIQTHGWKQLLKEIKKCKVVCANCHRKVHARKLNFQGVV